MIFNSTLQKKVTSFVTSHTSCLNAEDPEQNNNSADVQSSTIEMTESEFIHFGESDRDSNTYFAQVNWK